MTTMEEKRLTVLITGASGFIGKHLINSLIGSNEFSIRGLVGRNMVDFNDLNVKIYAETIDENTDWTEIIRDCDIVIHLAGIAHVFDKPSAEMKDKYQSINVRSTVNLAKYAVKAGVKKFIFLSSITVNGFETNKDTPFTENDKLNPNTLYASSKSEAEDLVKLTCENTNMSYVIIRPPLTYGLGVKGNFESLIKIVKKRIPLPLRSINNKRSFISVYNLVDFIRCCVKNPMAENQVFLVSDGEDVSIGELLRKTAKSMDCPIYLFSLPQWFLKMFGYLTKKQDAVQRLCGSMQVDITKARKLLSWQPNLSMDESLFIMMKDKS